MAIGQSGANGISAQPHVERVARCATEGAHTRIIHYTERSVQGMLDRRETAVKMLVQVYPSPFLVTILTNQSAKSSINLYLPGFATFKVSNLRNL